MKGFLNRLFNWEKWPYDVIYAPVSIIWMYYAIKARAFWFFTPVNPTLIFAGFEGGSKWEMYQQLPKWTLPITVFSDHTRHFEEIKKELQNSGLRFPFVAKPDTGMQGAMFTIIKSEHELESFHNVIGENYIMQAFVQYPFEFSVFHIRYPGEKKGMITGMVGKDFLHVSGDGKSTLAELTALHPLAKFRKEEMKTKHTEKWDTVLPQGETYVLNYAGNHRHGAKFINLNQEIDQKLHDIMDKISNEANHLYFGRYDLKCTSLEDLKEGKNIQILEYNGAGAVTIHMFDCGMSYFSALKEIVRHWAHLYRIGKINNKTGVRYWTFMEGYRFMQKTKQNFKRLLELEKSINSGKEKL